MAEKAITRRLKIYVNGKEVDATITNLRKNLAKFRAQSNRAVEGTDEWRKYNAEVARTETELKQAYAAQKQFRQETKLTEQGIDKSAQSLADFSGNINQVFQGLKRGDYLQVHEGFKGITTGIKGATKAALAFIATPIGAAIAVLVGIGAAAKAWFSYNTQVVEALRLTQQITGLTDQAADQARIRAEALVELFDVDFKDTLTTAKNLSQQFGISFNEAFDVLEDQLVRGQKNNDEFFQSLKEYPTFFAQAGFSAQEFARIVAAGFDLGIYNDKFPDAIKEFDISIREQTKSTRDALVNAFGAPFTDQILRKVKTGEITTKEALEAIAQQADASGLNIQANAQLTADLFRGAGEDAGGALKIFEAYNKALVDNQRELTESEKITKQQVEATKELKQVSSALFATGDKGFGLLIDKAKLFGTKLLVDILKAGVDVYNWFVDLNNESRIFSGILTVIGKLGSLQFGILSEIVALAIKQFKTLGTLIEGIFTLDVDKIKSAFNQGFANIGESIKNFKDKAIKDAEDIKNAFAGNNKLERKTIGDFTSDNTPTPTPTTTTTGGDGGGDELTPEDKKRLASRKKLQELLKQFDEEQKIQEELKKIEKDQRDEEEEVLRLENKFAKLEEEYANETDLLSSLEEAKENQLQQIRDKYADIRLEQQEKANDKRLKKEKKDKEKQLKLEKKYKEDLIAAEEELAQAKQDAVNIGINALRGLFNESSAIYKALFLADKAAAASNVIIDGIAERAKIARVYAANPLILAAKLTASKIRTLTNLGSLAATTIKGFELGGETFNGNYSGGVDGRGGQFAVVHPDEYVIPQFVRRDPEVPAIINYLESKRQSKLQGIEEPTPTQGATTTTNNENVLVVQAIDKLLTKMNSLKINYTLEDERDRRALQDKLEATESQSKT